MNNFLRIFNLIFKVNRVSIIMILLMLTIFIFGAVKSDIFLTMPRLKQPQR